MEKCLSVHTFNTYLRTDEFFQVFAKNCREITFSQSLLENITEPRARVWECSEVKMFEENKKLHIKYKPPFICAICLIIMKEIKFIIFSITSVKTARNRNDGFRFLFNNRAWHRLLECLSKSYIA